MSLLIQVHLWTALIAIPIGATQLFRVKGGPIHRRIGYAFAFCMIVTNLTALFIFQITGRPNIFHFFALLNLFTVSMALSAAIRRRHANWLLAHYFWMCYAYLGLLGASINEVYAHVGAFHRPMLAVFSAIGITGTNTIWTFTALNMMVVFGIGSRLVNRNAPAKKQTA